MNTKYTDLIDQTFDFPQEEFTVKNHQLSWHGINLSELIRSMELHLSLVSYQRFRKTYKEPKIGLQLLLKSTNIRLNITTVIVQRVLTFRMF